MGRPATCSCGECQKCKRREYMLGWYQAKTPEERKAWVDRRNPEVARQSDAKRKGTERRRASSLASSKRQRARNPEKYRARTALGNAVRDGKIIKGQCETCGADRVEAHHDDYSQPLEVRWFCRPHHKAHHGHLRPDYRLAEAS